MGDDVGEMSMIVDVRLPGDWNVDAIAAGFMHTCAILRVSRDAGLVDAVERFHAGSWHSRGRTRCWRIAQLYAGADRKTGCR